MAQRRLEPFEREVYCADKANMMFKHMERIFEDSDDPIIDNTAASSVKTYRSAIESIERMISVKSMQADVLRRVMEINQQELKSLAEDRRNHVLQADKLLSIPFTLPRLPEEIISNIFSILYFIDNDGYWEGRTINRLLKDTATPSKWKETIRRGIPIVVSDTSGDDLDLYLDSIENVVGSLPRLLSAHELDDSEAFPPWTSVSVLIHTADWPSAEELHAICRVRWNRLFVYYNARNDQDQRDFVLALLKKPEIQRKLSDVEYLEIPVKDDYFNAVEPRHPNIALESRTLEVDEKKGFKLRTARLPLPLLSTLRPILSQIADLQITMQPFMRNLNLAIDGIRPFSNTLVNFTLWGPSPYWASNVITPNPLPAIEQDNLVPFPALKCLKLARISEKNSRDMLSIFQCPGLEEISIEMTYMSEARFKSIYDSSQYVSVDFLHERLPSLKCLHICTDKSQLGPWALTHLGKPDANGRWLLPKLEAIVLDSVRNSILKTLTEVVVNRMKALNTIAGIHSVTIPGFSDRFEDTLQNAYLSTLNLLVPEVKITESRGYGL